MKKIFLLIIVFSFSILIANNREDTYLINPVETPHGILLTNNYESTLYLLNNGILTKLISAPGCGRFIQISSDGNLVGLKFIDSESYLQAPAIYDLEKQELINLSELVKNVGQVSFSENGLIAYTIENTLFVKDEIETIKYDLGFYTNRASISPNGKSVIYKNNSDQLILLDLESKTTKQITDDENGFYNAAWSPDNSHIVFQSINAKIHLYNIDTERVLNVGNGENPKWSQDSESILFFNKEIDFKNEKLINSDLFEYQIQKEELIQITDTENRFEMNPSYSLSGEIFYQNYLLNEVSKIDHEKVISKIIYKLEETLETDVIYSNNKLVNPDIIASLEQWEHIHQVWDTRDAGSWVSDPVNSDHQGYNCCGAASAMEIIASYGILPPDPINTHGHTSNYGKYISDSYVYNNNTYSGFSISSGRPGFYTGAHGFMWNNSGSPNSNAESFLTKHGIDASHSSNITWSKVKQELDLEFPYMLCSTSLTSGHIVVGIGQYGDGHTLYCNDPYGDKNAGNYGGIRNGKNAIYDWADANTGHITITPVVWGITARYSRTLRLTSTYPENNSTNIPISVNPKIYFYGEINPETLDDKIELIDYSGLPISISYDLSQCNEGIVTIIPSQMLDENKNYSIIVYNGIEGASGVLFNQNSKTNFTTGNSYSINGTTIDNFDSTNDLDFTTSGVDGNLTSFDITNEKIFDGDNSAKLEYVFTNPSGSYCRILYSTEPELNDISVNSIGLWVYGDNSKNSLQYWFSNEQGNLLMGYQESINWVGWKFVSLDLSTIENISSLTFNSFAVRQSTGGQLSGSIFFDNMILFNTQLEVTSCSPAQLENNVKIDSPIVVEFNKPFDVNSLQNAFQISPSTNGSFIWNVENTKLTFTPNNDLIAKTIYQISIDTSAKALDGTNLYSKLSYVFETERNKLSLISTYPSKNEIDISTKPDIILSFDEAILSSTLVNNVLFQDNSGNNVSIFVDQSEYINGVIKFAPTTTLEENSTYKIILSENIGDTKGLAFNENIEIVFTTESNKYISGNIFEDFENNTGWSNPFETDGSIGLDYISSRFVISNAKRKAGNYSGKLEYKFLGIGALCRTSNSEIPKISSQQNFGLWIFGDNSKNTLEYWFTNDDQTIEKCLIDTLNWTGWKLKSIIPSNFTSSDSIKFNSLVVKQTENGNTSGTIYLDDMQSDILLPVKKEITNIPDEYSLSQNYPNPFNPTTTIKYSIPTVEMLRTTSQHVTLKIYDILGREVTTLVNQKQNAGNYVVLFNASNLTSGIYFYKLSSGEFVSTKKLVLLK